MIIALVVFGPNKLARLGKSFGEAIRGLKKVLKKILQKSRRKGSVIAILNVKTPASDNHSYGFFVLFQARLCNTL
ncbi:MAG TPA: hypothetical protein DCP92_00260 [Nitrospiraceae bacterium]|nr:hypothetical protein [Nitrospiraceae bacterium]